MAGLADYERLRDQGWHAMARGELQRALADLERACELAADLVEEDEEILDKAEVNLAMIRLQLHDDVRAESGLRQVLLRSGNDDVMRLAAHCLAKILSRRGDHDRALRLARTSLAKARSGGEGLKICSALQLIGHVLVNESRLDEGLRSYRDAAEVLERNPLADESLHAFYETTVADMIGYVLVLQGDAQRGLDVLEPTLETARRHGIRELEAEISGDLCLALLHLARYDEARRHGERMLELSEELGVSYYRRNAYYLLGETASRAGDRAEAERWFDRLANLYPNVPYLRQFLCDYDISSLVNLKEFA